ncbi:uncharacterized protein BDW70DRAFT_97126 [Aspergillus foveolatus]|uniref:uncharacterized protein n=1 Tax=Aspergillus foveolatus TaxID=210207 RepID=UPI003CCDF779
MSFEQPRINNAASRKLTNANGPYSKYSKTKNFPPANKKFSIKHKRRKETIIKSAPSMCPKHFHQLIELCPWSALLG